MSQPRSAGNALRLEVLDGSIGDKQFKWLSARLIEASSRYLDAKGNWVTTKNSDKLTKAAERTAESVLDYLSTLPPQKAKAMREEIRQLAAKASRRAA